LAVTSKRFFFVSGGSRFVMPVGDIEGAFRKGNKLTLNLPARAPVAFYLLEESSPRGSGDDFVARLVWAVDNADVPVVSEVTGTPGAGMQVTFVADELEKLAGLRDRGVLSEDEFEAQKRGLLGA